MNNGLAKAHQVSAIKREQRRDLVMMYRVQGYGHTEIQKLLHEEHGIWITPQTIGKDVKARLDTAAERDPATQHFRELQRMRIEELVKRWWPEAMHGDLNAARFVLDAFKQESALLGLNAPVRAELSGPDGGPVPVDVASIIQRFTEVIEGEAKVVE